MKKAKTDWMAMSIRKNKVSLGVLPDTEVPFFRPEKFKKGKEG